MEKNIGIWLDSEKAYIISLLKGSETVARVDSAIDHFHLHGGYGSSTPYFTQDASSEKKLNERAKHQKRIFFKTIIKHISNASSIVIYGPAGTKYEMVDEIRLHNTFHPKIADVLPVDSMTKNQMKALVRNYFNKGKK